MSIRELQQSINATIDREAAAELARDVAAADRWSALADRLAEAEALLQMWLDEQGEPSLKVIERTEAFLAEPTARGED